MALALLGPLGLCQRGPIVTCQLMAYNATTFWRWLLCNQHQFLAGNEDVFFNDLVSIKFIKEAHLTKNHFQDIMETNLSSENGVG